jgi:thioredoxin-related protein
MKKTPCLLIGVAVLSFIFMFMTAPLFAEEPWLTDFMAAQQASQEKKRPILAAFVGSDWCPWCQKLETEIFNQPEFKDFVRDRFILFQADFPKHKELSVELKNQNQGLMKQYAVKKFPTVLFIDAEGKEVARTGFRYGGAENYVRHLKELLESVSSDRATILITGP